ncbi:TPA: phosphotransferase [Xanthomonas vasicola pv. zeae]|uniref:Phosphotransferase n=2 Tax=Xanthomonas vasicola pv. vasculorum TaxID=325776 RepID=A0AAE8FB15_XANVA|nr:phosphotransferase [Xanthomonas vasicola]AVQ08694.1 phosphotransferase [Xanthomonas vasicola pv. vasculorum]AZM72942.1 phosphotransferase [Xanthomonas vasicola pv. vasculorum]KEZ95515.1 phosphotransferase [Xanthomonas vasicola pv. vasculorum NCPPB 895]KFA37276.1 phosphotransferase [Xanthomonas vasicola pv. vasculorum NCPPB 206]MBV6746294.1 phosphotransferase [Xanthomonas vasicola pv. vasculorum NCPPB 890]
MQGRDAIATLIPHQGSMCLWEEVIEWDEQRIVLRSHAHRSDAHPLRSNGRLRALHLCEYGAQAMAVHGGLLGRASGKPVRASGKPVRTGMLVALRGVELHVRYLETLPGAIDCEAQLLMQGEDSQQYSFRLTHGEQLLAEGRAAVMLGAAKAL